MSSSVGKDYVNKRECILMHKLAALVNLTMECLDDLQVDAVFKEEHKAAFGPAMEFVEDFLQKVSIESGSKLKETSYIFELSKKIDTVMRKNYIPH